MASSANNRYRFPDGTVNNVFDYDIDGCVRANKEETPWLFILCPFNLNVQELQAEFQKQAITCPN